MVTFARFDFFFFSVSTFLFLFLMLDTCARYFWREIQFSNTEPVDSAPCLTFESQTSGEIRVV